MKVTEINRSQNSRATVSSIVDLITAVQENETQNL